MSRSPIPVHSSSRSRTMRATKMPAEVLMPKAVVDIRKPPSRPPNCKGMKKSRLAKRLVNARMRMQLM